VWKLLLSRADWLAPILAVLLTGLGSLWALSHTAKAQASLSIEQRVTALEQKESASQAHQQDQDSHIAHIETQVDKLVEWALGHK
jgi:hypothetical protein